MTMKPDFGTRLLQEGVGQCVDIWLYGFQLFGIDVLSSGQFSVMSEKQYAGE
jgi:hypothetical protein